MKRVLRLALLLTAFFAVSSVQAQDILTNSNIVSLWQAGTSDTLIVRMIEQNPGNYALTSNDLKQLIDNRIPDRVIQAMILKAQQNNSGGQTSSGGQAGGGQGGGAPQTAAAKQAAPAAPPKPAPPKGQEGQASVYYLRGNQWIEVLTEPVTWTRSGVTNSIKKWASVGISRPPVRGTLYGENSRTIVANPPEVVVNVPDGSIIHDFLIVPLQVEKGMRSVVIGGASKTDAAHRAIPFGVERIGPTQFRILFPNTFGPGEYGAFNVNSTRGETQDEVGRMYTFRIMPSM
jgi:hypothetical protein